MQEPARICKACGYDLAGIEASRCPECGRIDPVLTLSPRAQRWANRPRHWFGVPVALFASLLLVWCFTIERATGEQLTGLGSYIGLFTVPFFLAIFVHAIAWTMLKSRTTQVGLREKLWWLTLPFLHAVWMLWPLVILAGTPIVGRFAFARPFMVLTVPLLTPIAWRAGWMLMIRVSDIPLNPCPRHWTLATVLGIASTFVAVFMTAALIAIGV
ncbi:MAG: hypothetical protein ACTS27_05775 [Phycisphaerales bacterium]